MSDLTAHQRRVLETMRDEPDALVYERGAGWWCGCHPLDGRTAWFLIRSMLVTTTEESDINPWYLELTESGLRAITEPTP